MKQAGSAVRPDKLRFDFTHPQALTAEERTEVERRVNERVFANMPVRIYETPIAEARKLGAMMLFGEKYGEVVRVVDIDGWSRELCGGTHVRSTAEIGPFVILGESSVGAGARRVEAVTAGEAFALLEERAREADELRGELERLRRESKQPKKDATVQYEITDRVDGVVFAQAADLQPGPLRDLSDRIRQQEKADGAIVAAITDGRVHIVVNVAESVGVDAGKLAQRDGADRRRARRRQADDGAGGRQRSRGDPRGVRGGEEGARVKAMALDFGAARTGVAVSDPTGVVARPLCVVERAAGQAGLAELVRLVSEQEVETVIVGHPLTLRGERGEQARATERFAAALRAQVEVPVVLFDERFTTDLAQQTPSDSSEDARAAAHLLSSYLEWSASSRR